ncbi:MAG: metal-sensing transcriptional repressor [Dermatophilaceae bacterium]
MHDETHIVRRIESQVRGIERMIDEDRHCIELGL